MFEIIIWNSRVCEQLYVLKTFLSNNIVDNYIYIYIYVYDSYSFQKHEFFSPFSLTSYFFMRFNFRIFLLRTRYFNQTDNSHKYTWVVSDNHAYTSIITNVERALCLQYIVFFFVFFMSKHFITERFYFQMFSHHINTDKWFDSFFLYNNLLNSICVLTYQMSLIDFKCISHIDLAVVNSD